MTQYLFIETFIFLNNKHCGKLVLKHIIKTENFLMEIKEIPMQPPKNSFCLLVPPLGSNDFGQSLGFLINFFRPSKP